MASESGGVVGMRVVITQLGRRVHLEEVERLDGEWIVTFDLLRAIRYRYRFSDGVMEPTWENVPDFVIEPADLAAIYAAIEEGKDDERK